MSCLWSRQWPFDSSQLQWNPDFSNLARFLKIPDNSNQKSFPCFTVILPPIFPNLDFSNQFSLPLEVGEKSKFHCTISAVYQLTVGMSRVDIIFSKNIQAIKPIQKPQRIMCWGVVNSQFPFPKSRWLQQNSSQRNDDCDKINPSKEAIDYHGGHSPFLPHGVCFFLFEDVVCQNRHVCLLPAPGFTPFHCNERTCMA